MATSHSPAGPPDGPEIKDALTELGVQLSLLNHHLSSRLGLRTVDLDCFNLLYRHGPASIGALARRVGLRPATTTGVVDRLERSGWVVREQDPRDRRSVRVRAAPGREEDLFALLVGLGERFDEVLSSYDADDRRRIAQFLTRAAAAAAQEAGGGGDVRA